MKKTLQFTMITAVFMVAAVLFMGMASSDYRENMHTVGKIAITEMTWASGATGAQTEDITISGKCSQIEVDVAENTSNGITFTVAVATEDGGALFSAAAIADNGSTIFKATSDASDFDAFLMAEEVTVTVTASADPGATGATVNVGFYVE